MIFNIIDRRKRPYRWKRVTAIIEAVEHDNSCIDADQAEETPPSLVVDYERRPDVSISEAVAWATATRCPVTLYIYDADDETTDRHFGGTGDRFPEEDEGKTEAFET